MVFKVIMISIALLHVGIHVFEHHQRRKRFRKRQEEWQHLTVDK